MDARQWVGDDERDELTQDDDLPCWACGALPDEPCAVNCNCEHCQRRRAVKAFDALFPKDAA